MPRITVGVNRVSALMRIRSYVHGIMQKMAGPEAPLPDTTATDVGMAYVARIADPAWAQRHQWLDERALQSMFDPIEIKNPVVTGRIPGRWLPLDRDGKIQRGSRPYSVVDALLYCKPVTQERGRQASIDRLSEGYGLVKVRDPKKYRAMAKETSMPVVYDAKAMRESMREDYFSQGGVMLNQAGGTGGPASTFQTPFAPILSGPFYKNLFLVDHLTQMARGFEAYNHNPIARRIVDNIVLYALGKHSRIEFRKSMKTKTAAIDRWKEFSTRIRRDERRQKWLEEKLIFGETMKRWGVVARGPAQGKIDVFEVDPSTCWEVVTDPENMRDVYYYHVQFQTRVIIHYGAPPGQAYTGPMPDNPYQRYVVRQWPAELVDHRTIGNRSNEVRGRSYLFVLLSWLLRFRDYLDSEILRAGVAANTTYHDTVQGSKADIAAHTTLVSQVFPPLSTLVTSDKVKREVINPPPYSPSKGGIGGDVLSVIGAGAGMPQEHLNLAMSGAGSRATALVSSEPWTKVVEYFQGLCETEDHDDLRRVLGADYDEDGVESIYPSVTKDTVKDTIDNILTAETAEWISHETAQQMAAAEMSVTTFDASDENTKIASRKENQASAAAQGKIPGVPTRQASPTGTPAQNAAAKRIGNKPKVNNAEKKPLSGPGKARLKRDMSKL